MQFGALSIVLVFPILLGLAFALRALERQRREQRLRLLADPHLLDALLPTGARRKSVAVLPTVLFFSFLLLALMRPQWGFTVRETARRGVDIAFALDLSESMLAQDVQPSRLERARREIFDILDRLQGDRVGLVSFAGAAFIETPLTLDYGAFRLFVQNMSTASMPLQGTNIELAVKKAADLLKEGSGKNRSRALILITDGEELDGLLSHAAETLKQNNIQLFVLGVGTPQGGPIPHEQELKRDPSGQLVLTKLNEKALQDFAASAGGIYVPEVPTGEDTTALLDQGIRVRLKDETINYNDAKIWNEYFQIPLLLAFITLLGLVWREPRRGLSMVILLAILMHPGISTAEPSQEIGALQQGKRAFENGKFQEALRLFGEAGKNSPSNVEAILGTGASQYRLGLFSQSAESFLKASQSSEDPKVKSQALYDAANALVQIGEYEKAISLYKEAQKLQAVDREIAENLRYAEKLLQEQKKKEEEKKQQEKKEEEDKKQQKKDQDKQQQEKNQEKEQQEKQEQQDQQDQSNEKKQSQEKDQSKDDKQDPKDNQQEKPESSPTPTPQDTSASTPTPGASETPTPKDSEQPNPTPGSTPTPQPSGENNPDKNGQTEKASPTPQPTALPSAQPSPSMGNEPQPSEGDEKEKDKAQAERMGKKTAEQATADEQALEMLLNSIQEKGTPSEAYRLREAFEQLKANGQRRPKKDW